MLTLLQTPVSLAGEGSEAEGSHMETAEDLTTEDLESEIPKGEDPYAEDLQAMEGPDMETAEDLTEEDLTADAPEAEGVIRGFLPLQKAEFYFEGQPSEEDLTAGLPADLQVYLEGKDEPVDLPVSWEIVEDYADTDFYFYSARPVWEENLTLSSDLDETLDVPWITLYRQPSQEEQEEGEEELTIPVEEGSDLEPVYTEEEGSMDPLGSGLNEGSLTAGLAGLLRACTEECYAATNAEKAYKYLTETMGLNMAAACGVMTNLYAESGIQPNNLENTYNKRYGLSDSEYTSRVDKGKKDSSKGKYKDGSGNTRYFTTDYSGYGICQWTTSGRRTKLLKASNDKDVSISNMNMQLGVLQKELKNDYPQVWATLKNVPNNATGVYLAASHFCISFEVPANTNATAASRAKTAMSSYWKTYSGKAGSVTGSSHMGICGYTIPSNIKKGTGMTVSGHVISNYNITSVSAKIVNSKGSSVYSKTKSPSAKVFSLYNFDSSLLFSKLSSGTYTYVITAKDSYGKSITAKHEFKVSSSAAETRRGFAAKDVSTKAGEDQEDPTTTPTQPVTDPTKDPGTSPASTLKGVDLTYPTSLKKGKPFTIKGKVKSNVTLKKVTVSIRSTEGTVLQSATAKPSGKRSYSVKNLSAKLKFKKLKKGSYYYVVKATDTKQSKQLLKKKFTVK